MNVNYDCLFQLWRALAWSGCLETLNLGNTLPTKGLDSAQSLGMLSIQTTRCNAPNTLNCEHCNQPHHEQNREEKDKKRALYVIDLLCLGNSRLNWITKLKGCSNRYSSSFWWTPYWESLLEYLLESLLDYLLESLLSISLSLYWGSSGR